MAIIYQTNNFGDADLRVALVDRGVADLLVYRVASPGLARGDALWYVTRERQGAVVRVFFVSLGMAQLKICFVSNQNEDGWQNPRLRGVYKL